MPVLKRILPAKQVTATTTVVAEHVGNQEQTFTTSDQVRAWAVHALTLSGLVWATLATVALLDGNPHWMWLWLGVALIVDGIDGNLARKYRVKEVVSWFSGTTVDNVVDYLTWTAIPVLFMFLYLPLGPRPLAITLAIVVLVSSMFCYANEAAKSKDNYFVGFPAAWNIVAVLLWVWQAPMWVCVVGIVFFSAMTLVPLHYTHPFRVERGRTGNIIATFMWIVTTGALVYNAAANVSTMDGLVSPMDWYPDSVSYGLVAVNVAAGAWLVLGGLRRTFTGK